MGRILEAIVVVIIIGILGGVIDTFLQVNELQAQYDGVEKSLVDIKEDLIYIRDRVDDLHERN